MKKNEPLRRAWALVRGKRILPVDLIGILLAFGIAFGGLAVVQNRLAAERARLLEGSGAVEVLFQTQVMEAQEIDETQEQEKNLGPEELMQSLEGLTGGGAVNLHEPQIGQLSMGEAVESGKGWVEDFLLPRLRLGAAAEDGEGERSAPREYRASCFLWCRGEDSATPWTSYWTISLTSRDIDAVLILEAATGQILDAAVTSRNPIEYVESGGLSQILEDYVDSFGIEAKSYVRQEALPDGRALHRDCGDKGLEAVIKMSNIAVASSQDGGPEIEYVQEIAYINIYLEPEDWAMTVE